MPDTLTALGMATGHTATSPDQKKQSEGFESPWEIHRGKDSSRDKGGGLGGEGGAIALYKPEDPLTKILGQSLATLYRETSEPVLGSPATGPVYQPPIQVVDDFVLADFVASESVKVLSQDLKALGAEDQVSFGNIISARLPIKSLVEAADLDSLLFVNPVYTPIVSAGAVISQGSPALNADVARNTFGVDGSGITVGILSDSYNALGGAAADVASGDLPAGVQVLDDLDSGFGSDEGRAMAQLVFDVAPGVDLQFHTAFKGQANFAQGILDLAAAGSDIIVDDVIYFTEPMFQDGIIAQAIDQVTEAGVLYFSAAGNSASQSYESTFRGVSDPTLSANYRWHDFDPGLGIDTRQAFTLGSGESVNLSFQWDQPFASVGGVGSNSDLDLYILDQNDQVVASSTNFNVGADAVETALFQNTTGTTATYNLLLGQYLPEGGPTPTFVKYVDFDGGTSGAEFFTNSPTSYGHTNAEGSLAVGAAAFTQTPAFGTNPPRAESFSSLGGVPILFDVAGDRLQTPESRDNVDFIAPDGGNTTFFGRDISSDADGFPNFFGTSAAAPHAAGVAALLLEEDPSLTPAAVEQVLESTAIDTGALGYDRLTGFGLIQADAALAGLAQNAPVSPDNPDAPDSPATAPVIGEYGTLDALNQQWQTITLSQTYVNPVVIVSDPTINGGDPAAVRLQNIAGNTFQIRLQEPRYLDDQHVNESVSYLVMEAGDWALADGSRISAGTYNSSRLSSAGLDNVNLTGFDQTPTVLSQVQTFNGRDWVVTRTTGQSTSGFQIAMQEEEFLNNGSHLTETIGWLAVEPGLGFDGDTLLEGGTTGRAFDDSRSVISFDQSFDTAPSLIAKLGSYFGPDTANLRLDTITDAGFGARVYEEQSQDNELAHTSESISFLALEGQSGLLSGSVFPS